MAVSRPAQTSAYQATTVVCPRRGPVELPRGVACPCRRLRIQLIQSASSITAVKRPTELFDREQEWEDLDAFATQPGPGLRLALVRGRRRQGKSFLLRRL